MKLRNKKTGEIVIANITRVASGGDYDCGASLSKLNEEWEDYEEPKDYWFIDPEILIACESTDPLLCDKKVAIETMKQIGNYFETREEAEKAVEKLKAWKRLKDKGLRFMYNKVIGEYGNVSYILNYPVTAVEEKDLDLLFGGEE